MAVPFSDTILRVPPGFGSLLEGLAREVLRQQPEDIPTFAAEYFTALLKKREETGFDPTKTLLENQFSKNDTSMAVVNQEDKESGSPIKQAFQADSHEKNEDKITHPIQNFSPSPETLATLNDIVESEPQPNNEVNKSVDESPETDTELNPEVLYRGTAEVDICAEELNNTKMVEEQMCENIQGPASINEENETVEKEPDPVTLSSYHGLTDVDVCSEELQSTLREEECSEGDVQTVTDVGFIPPSESPALIPDEQDVLDTCDEFTPSETSRNVQQDVHKDINDSFENETVVAPPVKQDEISDTGHLSKDVREMTNILFDDARSELHNVEQLHPNEGAESISVSEELKTFDETSTDEVPLGVENQQGNDILTAEAMSESSFILGKASPAIRDKGNNPEIEVLVNVASEFHVGEIDHGSSVPDVTAAIDDRDSQAHMQKDGTTEMTNRNDKQNAAQIIWELKGQVDNNHNHTDISAEGMNEEDRGNISSQQDVDEHHDTDEIDQGNNDVNAPETQEDTTVHCSILNESKATSPTSEQTGQDMEDTYTQFVTDVQKHTEKPGIVAEYEESEHHESKVASHESENKEMDHKEESSQPQEEEDIMDIPLDDPEANKAAAKIQAGFRGHMTRKKLKPGDKPGEEQGDQKE